GDPAGESRIDAEDLEDSGQDEGIEGGYPGRRAAHDAEGIAETLARGEGPCDPSCLPAEAEIVGRERVPAGNAEDREPQQEGGAEHLRPGRPRPGRDETSKAGPHSEGRDPVEIWPIRNHPHPAHRVRPHVSVTEKGTARFGRCRGGGWRL